MRELHTTCEIMDALGGTQAVADLTGRKYSAAFNWRAFGAFPANTYIAITTALEAHDYTASPKLWGMVEQPESAS